MIPTSCILFAAGFGTRMGALTKDRPKPLIEVGGRPLADHALAQTQGVSLTHRLANLHYRPEPLEAFFAARGVATVRETPDILETGGGLKSALPRLGPGPVFTLNTDAVWAGPPALSCLLTHWRATEMDALLLCAPPERAHGHDGAGDFELSDTGRIRLGGPIIYTGAQIIKPDRLSEIPETSFSMMRLWERLFAAGTAYACLYPGHWCDVGHPEGIKIAEDMLRNV